MSLPIFPFDSLYPFWIGDGDVDLVFQELEHRHPVFSGRFHTDVTAGIVQQLFFELKNGVVEGGEMFFPIGRLNSGSGCDDCGNEKRFVDIDATAGLINNFHRQRSFLKYREKPLTVPPHI